MKAFISWSGGKDASLALHKAKQENKIEIAYLLNMVSDDGKNSRTHGISSDLLKMQSDLIGIPIIQKKTTWDTYEKEFKSAISEIKKNDINIGIFGDIDLQQHRDWVERVCKDENIQPIFPLWQKERQILMDEFINSGFESYVVCTMADVLDQEWIGRKIDSSFVEDLKKLSNIDLCGEKGEYHTFVVSGPIFKKRIQLIETEKYSRDNYHFLKILRYEIHEK
jgi:uncharacterized protein (TIGR00290 family)